jgi:probable F420-dependent oxidoreductase
MSRMKLDLAVRDPDLNRVRESAAEAERLGYDGLWTQETQHEALLPLAVAATVTSRIQLGTAIAVAFPRSPMITAHAAWDLQRASKGRFILGLGSQVKAHIVHRFSLEFESPGPKLREYVLALRAIWESWQSGGKLEFAGEFYRFSLMTPFFNPGPIEHPRIPVFVAAVNPWMCRMAGEVCEGLHVHPFHSPKYIREIVKPAVEEGQKLTTEGTGVAQRGTGFSYASSAFVIVGDTEQERAKRAEEVRQQIAFYASTRTYLPVLDAHGWSEASKHLHRKSLEGDWKGMAKLVTDEMLAEYATTGTFDDIGRKLRERYEGVLDRISLYQPYEVEEKDLRLASIRAELNG